MVANLEKQKIKLESTKSDETIILIHIKFPLLKSSWTRLTQMNIVISVL